LQDAVSANAIGQIGNFGYIERLPRLVGIALDGVAIEPDLAVLVARETIVTVAGVCDPGRCDFRSGRSFRTLPRATQQGF
jgi:hypothetical protein